MFECVCYSGGSRLQAAEAATDFFVFQSYRVEEAITKTKKNKTNKQENPKNK